MNHRYTVQVNKQVPVPMRDGTVLYADVFTPVTEQMLPVLLMRSPYDKSYAQHITYQSPEWFSSHGFIVMVQDIRGRFRSEGQFVPYFSEREDGFDTIRFARILPGANGDVGMYGFSYVGATQLQAAVEKPEGLLAIAPAFTNDGFYEDWSYKNGALHLAFLLSWSAMLAVGEAAHLGQYWEMNRLMNEMSGIASQYPFLPLHEVPALNHTLTSFYFEWLEHPTFDPYWKQLHLPYHYETIDVPALHIGGWYDIFIEGTIRNFKGMASKESLSDVRTQKLVIGPWYHGPWTRLVGELDFGEAADNFLNLLHLQWFQYWLKGEANGIMEQPPVSIFVMGANAWRQEQEWPLERTSYIPYYLHSIEGANSLGGDGTLTRELPEQEHADTYLYNPIDPVPSIGGHSCCEPQLAPIGPRDQRIVELRNDVLVYTSAVLQDDLEVTGPVDAVLYAASSADDTDFTVKLVDVHPDGRAFNLLESIQRTSFRESNENPTPIVPEAVYKYQFVVGNTSNLFKKGHCIRVEISSSNFPMFDRHLNQFRPDLRGGYSDVLVASQKVFHQSDYPSHLILPIIPSKSTIERNRD